MATGTALCTDGRARVQPEQKPVKDISYPVTGLMQPDKMGNMMSWDFFEKGDGCMQKMELNWIVMPSAPLVLPILLCRVHWSSPRHVPDMRPRCRARLDTSLHALAPPSATRAAL